jgi:hypothetical protein
VDPESKKLLEDTFRLAEENNSMLHKVRSVQKWAAYWSWLRMLIIIGIALGSFYFLEPYFNKIITIWDSISGVQPQPNSTPVQDFFKKF